MQIESGYQKIYSNLFSSGFKRHVSNVVIPAIGLLYFHSGSSNTEDAKVRSLLQSKC
jgi:hypothetical protein